MQSREGGAGQGRERPSQRSPNNMSAACHVEELDVFRLVPKSSTRKSGRMLQGTQFCVSLRKHFLTEPPLERRALAVTVCSATKLHSGAAGAAGGHLAIEVMCWIKQF